MAGARTQGVGRGVNWGAFGSMGQQYAQIGRTIESGGEALGKGIGGGLAAIGGAIERKKVRDQQAAERQAARADEQARFDTLRGDRLAENATDNAFRDRQADLQNQWKVYEDAQSQARWDSQVQQGLTKDRIAALNILADNDRQILQAASEGLVDPQMGGEAQRRLQSTQSALGALLGMDQQAGVGDAANTSSAFERPDPDALAQQMAEKRVALMKSSPLAAMLNYLPPDQARIAAAGVATRLSQSKRKEMEVLGSKTPGDLLKRKTLAREALIYENMAAPTIAAEKQKGMARDQARETARQTRLDETAQRSTHYAENADKREARAEADGVAKNLADQAKAEAEKVARRDAMLKTRKAVLDETVLPLPSDPRDEGMTAADIKGLKTSRIDSMDTSQIALAFTDNVTDEQAKALAGALLRRHGDARVAAQVAYDALPEEEQTQEASLRILNALNLDANGNPKSGK